MSVHTTSDLLRVAFLLGVFLATASATESLDPLPVRGHGDPCGYSPNQSLVCCRGMRRSTLIHNTEECCNGSPLRPNEICCDETAPVTKTSPDHDSCCLNPDTFQGVSFSSHQHFCHFDTGDVLELPSLVQTPNALSPSHGPLSSSDQKNSSREESPSFNTLCQYGYDISPSEGLQWRGELVGCCGVEPYFASRQTCCADIVYDSPHEDTLCCYDSAYRRGDRSNPCLAMCRGVEFNTDSQLCCQGVIHESASSSHDMCCGREMISYDTHTCCGEAAFPIEGPYRCCRHHLPYIRRYMQCQRNGQLTRKVRGQFKARTVCGRLPIWVRHWPTIELQEDSAQLLLVEGRVASITKSQRDRILLTLNPVQLIQSASLNGHDSVNASCLGTGQAFHIDINVGTAGRGKCRKRQLRRYLRERDLYVYFPLNALSCGHSHPPHVRVPSMSRQHLILLKSSDE